MTRLPRHPRIFTSTDHADAFYCESLRWFWERRHQQERHGIRTCIQSLRDIRAKDDT